MAQRYTVPARMRTQTNGSGTRRAQDSSQYGHHLTGATFDLRGAARCDT